MIRKAVIGDVRIIHQILNDYGSLGFLLPRSLSELYDHIRDFWVLEEDPPNAIAGACALKICWEDLAEIRSLAVIKGQQGRGLGRLLVEKCLEDARHFGIKRVFALTYIPPFFSRLGFHEVDKSILPHKVWADCLKCPKFPDCDEIAMLIEL